MQKKKCCFFVCSDACKICNLNSFLHQPKIKIYFDLGATHFFSSFLKDLQVNSLPDA